MGKSNMIKRADGSYSQRGLWDNIRANKGSGKKPTKQMLEQEAKIKTKYGDGGKLPDSILKSRLESHMSPEEANEYMANYGGGGYVVKRSSERKGKTHVVIGPDGTKKYFGDSNLGQHPNDPARKKAFYARHKHNLANNPYFRAFARKTWAEGGTIGEEEFDQYADGGIHIKPENKGKFTAWAKSHGMGVQEAASHVMANKDKYSSTVVKRANFAKNAAKFKHAEGGITNPGLPANALQMGQTYNKPRNPFAYSTNPSESSVVQSPIINPNNTYKPAKTNTAGINKALGNINDTSTQEINQRTGTINPNAAKMETLITPQNLMLGNALGGLGSSIVKGGMKAIAPATKHFLEHELQSHAFFAPVTEHAYGGLVKYPGGGETELNPPGIGNFTNIPVTNKFYNQPLADQTSQIANYAASNPNVKAGTFSIPSNNMTPKSNTPTIPLGYTDNVGYTPSVDTSSLPSAYNKKDWSQQYVPQTKSAYYTYNPTGQTYTTDQYNTYKTGAQPMTTGVPTRAMGGQLSKYRYVNGKFIPMHAMGEQVAGEDANSTTAAKKLASTGAEQTGFGSTAIGGAIKGGQAIAPALSVAQSFVGDNNTPLSEALNYGAQGASAGMMFGPWGAAIGGGLGLAGGAIKGYFDQEEQAKKQRELDQQKKNISTYNQLMGKAPQSNLAIKTNTQAMYAEGGMKVISRNHPNPQEEVEGGETAITPNGRNIQFRGPKHNNGGIKTNLPSGTRIFSDRIIYPG